jgi:hypothetical protein
LKKKIKKIYFFSKTLLKCKNKQGLNANLFFFWIFFLTKPTGLAGLKKLKKNSTDLMKNQNLSIN